MLAVLLAVCAPAPFLHPAVPQAHLAAPGLTASALAPRFTSPAFVANALALPVHGLPEPRPSPEWVLDRLRVIPQADGRSVRLVMERCANEAALAVLDALTEQHLRLAVPAHRQRIARNEQEARDNPKWRDLSPKHRALVLDYFRKLARHQAEGVILAGPHLAPLPR